jgi:hypothetical protein
MAREKPRTVLDKKGFRDFISESLKKRWLPAKQIIIGSIEPEAQKRIEDKSNQKISKIEIDSNCVIHAIEKTTHNLEHKDLLQAVDVINTATDIELSPRKHQDCKVLIFKKEIGNEITFLTEVHVGKDHLLVFDAWRQKRLRRSPDAVR